MAAEDPEARPYPVWRLWFARATAGVVALEEEFGRGARRALEVPAPGESLVVADRTFQQSFDWPRLPAGFAPGERGVDLGGAGPTVQTVVFEGADVLRVEMRHPFRKDALIVRQEWRRGAPWPARTSRTMEIAGVGSEEVVTSELVAS